MSNEITRETIEGELLNIRTNGAFHKNSAAELISLFENRYFWEDNQSIGLCYAIVQALLPDPIERERMLAAFGLLKGYESIEKIEDRREKYCRYANLIGKWKNYQSTLQKRENSIIGKLSASLFAIIQQGEWQILKTTLPEEWELPTPRYLQENPVPFPFNNLPHSRNECFVGRDEKLGEIHANFHSEQSPARIQIVSGMGGGGKTQLALEYAHRYYESYDNGILWLNSETPETLAQSVSDILESNGFANSQRALLSWMENNSRWLLIYDNVDDYNMLLPFLPKSSTGHILITTRLSAVYKGGRLVELPVFTEEAAVSFLHKRTGFEDKDGAENLVHRLGYFPLALEQAAAYIVAVPNMNYRGYFNRLNQYGLKILDKKMELTDYARTIRETLEISLEKIRDTIDGTATPNSAEQFLYLCAYMAPDGIDAWAFQNYPEFLPEPLKTKLLDELEWDSIIYTLTKFSFMKPDEDYGYTMHRLLQEIIRDKLCDDDTWATCCFESFYKLISARSTAFQDAGAFINRSPHAIAVAEHMDAMSERPDGRLAAMYHWFSYSMAGSDFFMFFDIKHMNRAIELYETLLGANHPETAMAYLCMADIFERKGDMETASIWQQRAAASGVIDPHTNRGIFFDWFDNNLSGYYM